MKKSTIAILLASTLAMSEHQAALAGNRPGAITFTPGVGYVDFASKRQIRDTAAIPLLGLAYNFDSKWAIEVAYSPLHTRFSTSDGGQVVGNLSTLDGLYRFFHYGMFEPYASAGMGVLYLNPNGNSSTNQADLNVGLGTQVFFAESIALRGEVRDLYTMSGGKNDVMFDMGVSFLFLGDTPSASPVSYKDEIYRGDK